MSYTLKINEVLYCQAQAEATRLGISTTRFIEDALRQKLGRKVRASGLPVFDSGVRLGEGFDFKRFDSLP